MERELRLKLVSNLVFFFKKKRIMSEANVIGTIILIGRMQD